VVINNVLYKLISDHKVPVIPSTMIPEILEYFHDSADGCHLGITKTYSRMKHRVYFPQMKKTVVEYVRTCNTCQQVNYDNVKPAGVMSSPVCSGPWESLHMDLMGPYVTSHPGSFNYLSVVIDYFTKWVEIFPVRRATTRELAKILERDIFCRYGLPKRVVTDNASNFISQAFKNLLARWNIIHFPTPVYTPQVNLTERSNRTIKQMLRAFLLNNSHNKWSNYLHLIQLALNTSFQESTKCTPARAFLNRTLTLPIDNALETPNATFGTESYANILSFVRQNLNIAAEKQKVHYDKCHNAAATFNIGDRVLLKNISLSSKTKGITSSLNPLYGNKVCTIITKHGESVFTVRLPCGNTKGPLHISFLRKYKDRDDVVRIPVEVATLNASKTFPLPDQEIDATSDSSMELLAVTHDHDNVLSDKSSDVSNLPNNVEHIDIDIQIPTTNFDVKNTSSNMSIASPNLSQMIDLSPHTTTSPSCSVPLESPKRNLRSLPRWDYAALQKGKGKLQKSKT